MGKFVNIMAIACLGIQLVSCKQAKVQNHNTQNDFHLYTSMEGYAMNVPLGYSYSEFAPSNAYFYFGYPHPSSNNIRTIEFHPVLTSCTSAIMGSSKAVTVSRQPQILWGHVDFFEHAGHDYIPGTEPKCRPPGDGAAYVLCSEKDGKTVLVCVTEITDNPTLAEQIFRTFKWK
jgi:hypothetical protein